MVATLAAVEVHLLGQLRVAGEHGDIPLNGPHVRALFVLLALQPGTVRSRRALAEALWPMRSPTDPNNALQTHVSRLRRQLGIDVVATTQGGYRLDIEPMSVDVTRFEAAIARGRHAVSAGHARAAAATLDQALALWHGEPFVDLHGFPRLARAAAELADLHAEAVDLRAQAGLMLDDAATVVASLRTQLERHPFREHSYVLLMQALYRMGNQVEALRVGSAAGRVLRDRAGLEPGAELREMEQMILHHDARLTPGSRIRPAAGAELADRRDEIAEILDSTFGDDPTWAVLAVCGAASMLCRAGQVELAARLALLGVEVAAIYGWEHPARGALREVLDASDPASSWYADVLARLGDLPDTAAG